MKFQSIKEYFYKLTTIGFILLLLPLVVFIFLYYYLNQKEPVIMDRQTEVILLCSIVIIFLIALTSVHWLYNQRVKRLKKLLELARKMEGFFSLTFLKLSTYCTCGLIASVGFYLTANSMFTGLFILIAIAAVIQWPSPSSFCRRMDLRGSERDMVLNNRDIYQKNKRVR